MRGAGQPEWMERLQVEKANLSVAVRWFLAHDIKPLPHLFPRPVAVLGDAGSPH